MKGRVTRSVRSNPSTKAFSGTVWLRLAGRSTTCPAVAQIIDGKAIAQSVRVEVARGVAEFTRQHARAPGLHVVLVGDDPASAVYVGSKERIAREVGIAGQVHRLPASIGQSHVAGLVSELNGDARVDGILVQLPLPRGYDPEGVLARISADKDVDGLHETNVGRLWSGREALVPCTPRGCMRLLQAAQVPLDGARAVVVGRSNIVGKPVAALLLQASATVTLAHSRTRQLDALCREADVLIVAVGRPRFVPGDWIAPGATVIDVGVNRDAAGKLCGDVDFASAQHVAGSITPVPGGVGPMTIAMLMDNTLRAALAREGARSP